MTGSTGWFGCDEGSFRSLNPSRKEARYKFVIRGQIYHGYAPNKTDSHERATNREGKRACVVLRPLSVTEKR